jgi:hypothetical protein
MSQQRESEQYDIRSVGWMMMAIVEPGNALTNPKTAALKKPEGWSRDIQSFQQSTIRSSIQELLVVSKMT